MSSIQMHRSAELFKALSPEPPLFAAMIRGEPSSKARSRVGRGGRVYASERQRQAERELGWALKLEGAKPYSGNLAVACVFYRSSRQRIDVDNMLKHVMDSANGICWHDDSQVTAQAGIVELDVDDPRTEIVVGRHDSSMLRVANTVRVCEFCQEEYIPKLHRQRFCSIACSSRSNGSDLRPEIRCKNCGALFKRRTYKQVFCSDDCRVRGVLQNRTKIVNACDDCGKEIENKKAARCRSCWRTWNARVK